MEKRINSENKSVLQPILIPKTEKEESGAYQKLDEPHKTIRIAVSGNVILTNREVMIIDTPEFQKLRKYRQLGSSYLVYPSANHTRFEHSLGVLNMAEIMMTAIEHNPKSIGKEKEISKQQRRITRLVALLHDIGNLPFGHTLEDETHVINSNQDDSQRLRNALSETTSIGRVLRETLNDPDYQLLFDVLQAKETHDSKGNTKEYSTNIKTISELNENAFIVDIVKNTVCADLLDYLERDAYFCNLDLDTPNTFLNYLYINQDNQNNCRRVAIRLTKNNSERPRQAIISELIQLLETRYFVAERVYFHHAKQISSAMIASAVYYATHQVKYPLTLKQISEFGDDELLSELKKDDMNTITKYLANAYCHRKLYKQIYSLPISEINDEKLELRLKHFKETYHDNATKRAMMEQEMCEIIGLESGSIIIYCPNPDMNLKTAEMRVNWGNDVIPLKSITDRFITNKINSITQSHEKLWQLQVFVTKEIKDESIKAELVRIYCKKVFEAYDEPDGDIAQLAMIKIIEDCIVEYKIDYSMADTHKLVDYCLDKTREGHITRDEIVEKMKQKNN